MGTWSIIIPDSNLDYSIMFMPLAGRESRRWITFEKEVGENLEYTYFEIPGNM